MRRSLTIDHAHDDLLAVSYAMQLDQIGAASSAYRLPSYKNNVSAGL